MITRPKIATPEELDRFVFPTANNFEIQALGRIWDMPKLLKQFQSKLLETNRTTEFTIHAPPCEVAFELLSVYARKDIDAIISVARCLAPIRVNILFHIYTTTEYFHRIGAFEYLQDLLSQLDGTNVTLLFENTLLNMNDKMDVPSSALELVQQCDNPHLRFCLDLCHFQISQDISGGMHLFPQGSVGLTSQIHFAARLNNDGFMDVRTHGRRHRNELHLIQDLRYLEIMGYDLSTVPLVLEINEEDYENRPDLLEEIRMIELIRGE